MAVATAERPMGRPRIAIDVAEITRLAALGLSADQIADRLGVSRRTLFNRMNEDPAAREAMDQGLSEGIDFAASKLHELISEKNLGAICFYLRTRGHWRAAPQVIQVTHSNTAPPTIDGHIFDLAARQSALLDLDDDGAPESEAVE